MKKLADWLFLKFCNPDFYSDIRGDLEEIYYELCEEKSEQVANWLYFKEILLLFRISLLRPVPKPSFLYQHQTLNPIMLKSYFLLALRHLKKNKLISAFNLLGLSMAIACGTVIFIFLEFEYNVDHFHKDHERIFLVGFDKIEGKKNKTYGYVPEAVGEILSTDFAKVEKTVCMKEKKGIVQFKKNSPFYETITFTDKAFVEVFNFPLSEGNINELSDPSKVIISQKMAEKYFGFKNPMGEVLQITIDDKEPIELIVGGVAKKFNHKRSFEFSLLVNDVVWRNMYSSEDPWLSYNTATFVKMQSAEDVFEINTLLDKQLPTFAQKRREDIQGSFTFMPLSTLSLETYRIRNDIVQGHGNYSGKYAFAIIGILLLTIACLNYINTATAQGAKRIKEIGVRKVIGGKKSSIISQFLMENFVLNSLALIVGVIIAYLFLLPVFDGQFSFGLQFEWGNPKFWLFVLITLFTSTLLSGAYPAFYLSKFQPSQILKGNERLKFKNTFSKVFLTVQFFIAFVYIVIGLLFTLNTSYQQGKDIGYQTEDIVVVKPEDASAYNFLKAELLKNPLVKSITGAESNVGYSWLSEDFEFENLKNKTHIFTVSNDYLEKLSFELVKGKVPQLGDNNETEQIIVNETFAKALEKDNVMEKEIRIEGKKYFIAGVVKDFHYKNFNAEIEPALFTFKNDETYRHMIVKASRGNEHIVLDDTRQLWKKVSPSSPYNGYLQSDMYDSFFNFMKGVNAVTVFASLLAVLLSCTGLFGLVYLDLMSRLKDYSVMKVMGANPFDLTKKVLRIFILFLLVAIVLGFPVSLYGAKLLFGVMYNNHIPINLFYPTISAIFLIAISVATIASLIRKVNKQSPVLALRKE